MKKHRILWAVLLTAVLILSLAGYFKIQKPTEPTLPEGSELVIHFIDVGQADAALVSCDGKNMLIDAGNVGDSSLMYTYLENNGVDYLDIVVGTHAHEDHIGGMAGALNFAKADTVLCPVTNYESEAFDSFLKYVDHHGTQITVPSVGDRYSLGSAEVVILGCNSTEDTNNSSIVLKITYGDTSFLFTGDAEREAEEVILNSGTDLSATVLKVGHHGSNTSTSYPFLREIMPKYAVISVGTGNDYGHPHEEPLSRLSDADVTVYRTDLLGDVICKSDGKTVSFEFPGKQSRKTSSSIGISYVLNESSKKFHYPDCSSVASISEKNRADFGGTREEAVLMGYSPCGGCKP